MSKPVKATKQDSAGRTVHPTHSAKKLKASQGLNTGVPISNKQMAAQYRLGVPPNLSKMADADNYNLQLNIERDLDRYRTIFSSKTNIFDNSRVVSPSMNYLGIKMGRFIDPLIKREPAGFDGVNNTVTTGEGFTKSFVKRFSVY